MYRGKALPYSFSEMKSMIQNNDFSDLYLGDHVDGYYILGFNLFMNHGNDNKITKPHAILSRYTNTSMDVLENNAGIGYYSGNRIDSYYTNYTMISEHATTMDYKVSASYNADKINSCGMKGACDSLTNITRKNMAMNELQILGCNYLASNRYYDSVSATKQLPIFDLFLSSPFGHDINGDSAWYHSMMLSVTHSDNYKSIRDFVTAGYTWDHCPTYSRLNDEYLRIFPLIIVA